MLPLPARAPLTEVEGSMLCGLEIEGLGVDQTRFAQDRGGKAHRQRSHPDRQSTVGTLVHTSLQTAVTLSWNGAAQAVASRGGY
jgi:hypothetical protein